MPTFNDSDNRIMVAPEGDYVFTVTDCECKLSNGAKTAGSDQFELEMTLEGPGNRCWETLTDHPSTAWKIDCFLKSAGITLKKGEAYEFREDLAKSKGVRWINPVGLRGWGKFTQEEYPKASGKKRNRVAQFYTDKAKLPPVVIETKEEDRPF